MKKFEFLEHSADIFVKGYGKDLRECFENTAIGMSFYVVESDNIEPKVTKTVEVESENKEALLFDFLTEFLILTDGENLVFHDIKVESLEEKEGKWKIKAVAKGEEFDREKHSEGTHIKAITYHDMEFGKEENIYYIKVLVDI